MVPGPKRLTWPAFVNFKNTVLANAYPSLAIYDSATGGFWIDQEKQAWVDPNRQEVWNYNTCAGRGSRPHGI